MSKPVRFFIPNSQPKIASKSSSQHSFNIFIRVFVITTCIYLKLGLLRILFIVTAELVIVVPLMCTQAREILLLVYDPRRLSTQSKHILSLTCLQVELREREARKRTQSARVSA